MSRAFVKEPDGDDVPEDLPERTHSDLPNYITKSGLKRLQAKIARLEAALDDLKARSTLDAKAEAQRHERDLRYLRERARRAIPTEVPEAPAHVQFGVTVELVDENDNRHVFTLVGEDETDIAAGRICWASPVGRLLTNREPGDVLMWPRGGVDLEVEIVRISVEQAPGGCSTVL